MRKQSTRTLVIAAITTSLVHAFAARALADPIPDKALERVVRSYILDKKDKPDELTDDDLKKVFVLEAKGKGIKDLTGLEKCVNIQLINFANNQITSVTPLKELTSLQSLDLSANKIADVSPLAGLVGLQFLDLSDNLISALQPLSKIDRLSALYVAGNKIVDVAPLGGLTRLSMLDLARNQIADIKPLAPLTNLSVLKLSDNQVSDLSSLKPTELRMLLLERNKVSDLSPLVALAKADVEGEKRFAPFLQLYLAGNPLSDGAKNQLVPELQKYGVRVEISDSTSPAIRKTPAPHAAQPKPSARVRP